MHHFEVLFEVLLNTSVSSFCNFPLLLLYIYLTAAGTIGTFSGLGFYTNNHVISLYDPLRTVTQVVPKLFGL